MFIYWLGTEPFLYIADPEFLKKLSAGIIGKSWGKPTVFKKDRKPMFGDGLVMVEGEEWVRLRHLITPAFSWSNLKVSLFLFYIQMDSKILQTSYNHVSPCMFEALNLIIFTADQKFLMNIIFNFALLKWK